MAVRAADAGSFAVHAPATGTYAIAVVHDENSNNKMDKAIFVPTEGFGFSRNPTITVGPPSFTSASFPVAGDMRQSIRMKYMLSGGRGRCEGRRRAGSERRQGVGNCHSPPSGRAHV